MTLIIGSPNGNYTIAIAFLETTRDAAIELANRLGPPESATEREVVESLRRISTACAHALATSRATSRNTARPARVESPRCRNRKGQLSGARFVGRREPDATCALCKKPRKEHEFDETKEG